MLLVHSGDLAEVGWFNGSGALLAVRLASDDIWSEGSLLAERKPVLLVSKLLPALVIRHSRMAVRLGIVCGIFVYQVFVRSKLNSIHLRCRCDLVVYRYVFSVAE